MHTPIKYLGGGKKLLSRNYLSRMDFFLEECKNKSVLHLGCSSGQFIQHRLDSGDLLHLSLNKVAKELYGVDIHEESLIFMSNKLGIKNLYWGDVEALDKVDIHKKFDVVVAGDLLEHLSCPGAMLDGVKRFLLKNGKFIASTNNAFGLHYQLRRWLGFYGEHPEHVCFFSPETLLNLFGRHDYDVTALYGSYTRPPWNIASKIKFIFGKPLFNLFPILAGTLIVVSKIKT